MQIKMPRLMETHSGSGKLQSAHTLLPGRRNSSRTAFALLSDSADDTTRPDDDDEDDRAEEGEEEEGDVERDEEEAEYGE